MRLIQASDAKTHLSRLLDEVERGETLVITRHGMPIARIIPEPEWPRTEISCTLESIRAIRRTEPPLLPEETLPERGKGRKY